MTRSFNFSAFDTRVIINQMVMERSLSLVYIPPVSGTAVYVPDPENKKVYERNYRVFKKLYKANAKLFRKLNG